MLPKSPHSCCQNQEEEPQNPREWGLFHEESAWNISASYQPYPPQTGTGLKRLSNFKVKAFLDASVGNINKCQCSDGCPNKVLECKCPWKHRDMGSEEAFLILKIGGVVSEKGFALKPSSQYYFQLQLQMFVSKLSLNILVVWTKKGVFAVDVPLNPSFMTKTCVPSLRCFCLSSFSLS